MPTPYIEKLSKEGYGSVQRLELLWEKARQNAVAADRGRDHAYITGVFNKMVGVKTKGSTVNSSILLRQVATRLRQTAAGTAQQVDSVTLSSSKGSYSGTFTVTDGRSLVVKDKGRELLSLMPPFGARLTFPPTATAVTIRGSTGTYTGAFTLSQVSSDALVGTVYAVKDKTGTTFCEIVTS